MLKILSLHDFECPVFDNTAAVALIDGTVHYCTYDKLQDEIQPFSKYLREYPEVSITQEMLTTRDSARTISAGELFLPIRDSIFKKIANTWREKGLFEAIRFTAAANPEQVTSIMHWIATRCAFVLYNFDRFDVSLYRYRNFDVKNNATLSD